MPFYPNDPFFNGIAPSQLRRGSLAQVQQYVPAAGELVLSTDTTQLYVGDGTTVGGLLISSTSTGGGGGTGTNYNQSLNTFNNVSFHNITSTGTISSEQFYVGGTEGGSFLFNNDGEFLISNQGHIMMTANFGAQVYNDQPVGAVTFNSGRVGIYNSDDYAARVEFLNTASVFYTPIIATTATAQTLFVGSGTDHFFSINDGGTGHYSLWVYGEDGIVLDPNGHGVTITNSALRVNQIQSETTGRIEFAHQGVFLEGLQINTTQTGQSWVFDKSNAKLSLPFYYDGDVIPTITTASIQAICHRAGTSPYLNQGEIRLTPPNNQSSTGTYALSIANVFYSDPITNNNIYDGIEIYPTSYTGHLWLGTNNPDFGSPYITLNTSSFAIGTSHTSGKTSVHEQWVFDNQGALTFPDGSIQTTAYALTTTSDVTFNSADISTSITFGPTDLGYPFFNRAKLEVASGYGGGGNVSITVPSVWSTITNALVITNGSENSPQFHLFDGITLSNSGPSDLILGSGNEYITASKDGNIYFGTANTFGKTTFHHQWKLSNTGTMTFPDGSVQTTAYLGFTQTQAFTNIFLNEAVNISGDTGITLPNENTKVIDSFRFSEYRTAKYIVQIGSYYDNSIMIAELMITFDGTLAQNAAGDPGNIYISEYGIIAPSGILGTFNAELRDGTNYIDVTFVAFQYPTPTGWHITTSKTYLNNH